MHGIAHHTFPSSLPTTSIRQLAMQINNNFATRYASRAFQSGIQAPNRPADWPKIGLAAGDVEYDLSMAEVTCVE